MRVIFVSVEIMFLAICISAFAVVDFEPKSPDARPVSFLSSTTAVLNWETSSPFETKIQLREGALPACTPGHENTWKKAKVISSPVENMKQHSLTLTNLKPATRYYYRIYDPNWKAPADQQNPNAWSAEPPWTREYAFTTRAKHGEKAFIRIPVKVLIVPNVIDFATIKPDAPLPEKMPDEDIEMYKHEFRTSVLFYWINSRMNYFIDLDFFVEPEWQRVGEEREDLPDFYKGWRQVRGGLRLFDSGDISNHEPVQPLKEKKLYFGQVVMRCTRQWNEKNKEWAYQRSGGGTFGVVWMEWEKENERPMVGRTEFLGGSDIAWLMTHEYKHQLESQYKHSGMSCESDRMIFCHYAPRFVPPMGNPWKWDTAYSHGRHFDGIAYELRTFTDIQYLRNIFGTVEVTKDADNDGVPEDEPRLPFDEKRFGSDPKKASTDGSGVTDLEKIMFAKWIPAVNQNSRGKVFNNLYQALWQGNQYLKAYNPSDTPFMPNPHSQDSDYDGIKDIDDLYPLYPWQPIVKRATMQIDGKIDDWKEIPLSGKFIHVKDEATVRMAYDHDYLYYLIETNSGAGKIEINLDSDADGFTVGNDNLQLIFTAQLKENDPHEGTNPPADAERAPDGRPILRSANIHMASSRSWPYWDTGSPFVIKANPKTGSEEWTFQRPKIFGDRKDIKYASVVEGEKRILEIGIPNGTGRMPVQAGPGHVIAHDITVSPLGKGPIAIYEPMTMFRVTLE